MAENGKFNAQYFGYDRAIIPSLRAALKLIS